MKARVKAKQVAVMTDSLKQVIEVNKEYHRQIMDLKKQVHDKEAKFKKSLDLYTSVAKDNLELLNNIRSLENVNRGNEQIIDSLMKNMPVEYNNGDLVLNGIHYRKNNRSIQNWLKGLIGK